MCSSPNDEFGVIMCFLVNSEKSTLVYSGKVRKYAAPCDLTSEPINKCPGYLLLCSIFYVAFMVPIIP